MNKKTNTVLKADYIELFLQIYLLAEKIKSLVKVKNVNRFHDLVVLTLLLHRSATVTKLAEMLSVKPSAMSEKVHRLLKTNLVEITESTDAREKKIRISKKGKTYWQEIMSEICQHCAQNHPESLNKTEIHTVLEILQKIHF